MGNHVIKHQNYITNIHMRINYFLGFIVLFVLCQR